MATDKIRFYAMKLEEEKTLENCIDLIMSLTCHLEALTKKCDCLSVLICSVMQTCTCMTKTSDSQQQTKKLNKRQQQQQKIK